MPIMLCETHKHMFLKSGAKLLALAGIALVAMGATTVRTHLRAGAHGALRPAYSSVAPGVQPTPKRTAHSALATRRFSAAHARATISLYEHSVRRSHLRGQGCHAAKRGV